MGRDISRWFAEHRASVGIAERGKDFHSFPILLLSSKSEDELRRVVRESGADGFIRKPVTNRLLVEKINDAIR